MTDESEGQGSNSGAEGAVEKVMKGKMDYKTTKMAFTLVV
jgi:hypothetical protein